MKKILIALVVMLAFTQCRKIDEAGNADGFTSTVTEYGLYNNATPIYGYNIDRHQTSVTKLPTYRFVMQTDDQSEYIVASLSAAPDELNQTVDVDLKAVGASGVKDGLYSMKIVKINSGKIWLWNEAGSLGLVISQPLF